MLKRVDESLVPKPRDCITSNIYSIVPILFNEQGLVVIE